MSSTAKARAAEMASDLKEMAQSFSGAASELARRWAGQRVVAVQHYGRIIGDYGAGRSSGRATAQAVAKLAADEAARYPVDAYQFWNDYWVAAARSVGLSAGPSGSTARSTQAVLDIELTGKLGSVATRAFILENPHMTDVEISFSPTNFRSDDAEIKASPQFDPAAFSLPAGGECKVAVAVKLDRRKFRAGECYSANVAISGFDDTILRVHLTVIDPD
jgi:hypothetical protein